MSRQILQVVTILFALSFLLVGCAGHQAQKKTTKYYISMPLSEDLKRISDHLTKTDPDAETWNYAARIVANGSVMNATVHPKSQGIYFTSGLISRSPRDEIRCVMAHEVAHIELGHYGKRVAVATTTSAGMSVLNALIPGAGLASWVVNPAINRGFSRTQEVDADLYAVKLVNEVWNIPPETCVSMLERLKVDAEAKGRDTTSTGIYDTHPNLQYRIEKIKEQAEK